MIDLYAADGARTGDAAESERSDDLHALLAAIVEGSNDPIYGKTLEGVITSWNPAAERVYGYTPQEAIGKPVSILIPPDHADELPAILDRLKRGERTETFETVRMRKDGSRVEVDVTISPIRNSAGAITGASTLVHDITERKRQETERRFLAEATEALASSLDYERTLKKVAELAVPRIADWCAIDMIGERGEIKLVAVAHVDPAKTRWARELRRKRPPNPDDTIGLPNVLRTGVTEMTPLVTDEMILAADLDSEQTEIVRQVGFLSVMIVPILSRGSVLGAITLVTTTESGKRFIQEDRDLAEALADRAALAVDNAKLYRAAQNEIAERIRIEESLRERANEVEALNKRLQRAMSETHHRVKNNLQVISALVDMQVMQGKRLVPVDQLRRIAQHIRSLAAIHDMLTFQAKTDTEVLELPVRDALARLLPIIQELVPDRRIHLDVNGGQLPVRLITALIVLVNELLSNALKHGSGDIGLTFYVEDTTARLVVTDSGPGFPAGFESQSAARTGLDLVDSLAEWDLRGSVTYTNRSEGGANVAVTFPLTDY